MRISLFFILLLLTVTSQAQEENTVAIKRGSRYVDLRIKSLKKCDLRFEKLQSRLLKKLQKEEERFVHKLKKRDSITFSRYQQQSSPSFDSIRKLSHFDSSGSISKFTNSKNKTIDTLKGVRSFVAGKSGEFKETMLNDAKNIDLNNLCGKLSYRNNITQLITKRTSSLKNIVGANPNLAGFKTIEKQVFYCKKKMKVFKEMEEDPTVAEGKAMEYLQGQKGFEQAIEGSTQGGSSNSVSANGNIEQLEIEGFQTKRLLQGSLQQKFGGGLGNVGKQAGEKIKTFQDKQKDLAKLKEGKQTINTLKHTDKPSFKVNQMRGLPFLKRIEKQYSFQTARPSADGKQPAIIEPSVMVAFKHTPKLMYGFGIATAIGLGQSWQKIHFSYQGVGVRTFAKLEWQYGIGVYAGYERMYKQFAFIKKGETTDKEIVPTTHNTLMYKESVLVGLTKSYNLDAKYNGAIQVLYDVWWQQKGLNSPVILRFVTTTK